MNPTRAPGTSDSTPSSMPTPPLLVGEVFRCLVGEGQGRLVPELPEHLRRRRDVPQEPELVLDERMRDDGDLACDGSLCGARHRIAPMLSSSSVEGDVEYSV